MHKKGAAKALGKELKQLEERFEDYLSALTKGKDLSKVRIVVE